MAQAHTHKVTVRWTGNDGDGTSGYRSYRRDHEVSHGANPVIAGSADPAFRGTADRWNPEQLLVAALAECHLLMYLHLAAEAGVVVESYVDEPVGEMQLEPDGSGQFTSVILRPQVAVRSAGTIETAESLHAEANRLCFIARSVQFEVSHQPSTTATAT